MEQIVEMLIGKNGNVEIASIIESMFLVAQIALRNSVRVFFIIIQPVMHVVWQAMLLIFHNKAFQIV